MFSSPVERKSIPALGEEGFFNEPSKSARNSPRSARGCLRSKYPSYNNVMNYERKKQCVSIGNMPGGVWHAQGTGHENIDPNFRHLPRPAFNSDMNQNKQHHGALNSSDPFPLQYIPLKLRTLSLKSKPGCNCIIASTIVELIAGKYDNLFKRIVIVDCRFGYEYEGGHIKGAINLTTPDSVESYFFGENDELRKMGDNVCVIFHCEFSSHRGPKLLRHLVALDQQRNVNEYPKVDYPQVYLLHGGYRELFQTHKFICQPINYVEMRDPRFKEELKQSMRIFRTKKQLYQRSQSATDADLMDQLAPRALCFETM